VQKHTLGEIGNRTVVWWTLCQKYSYQKLSKSDNWFSSYSQKCRGCFFETQCKSVDDGDGNGCRASIVYWTWVGMLSSDYMPPLSIQSSYLSNQQLLIWSC